MLGAHSVDKSDVDFWALHPGGHRIVEVSSYQVVLPLCVEPGRHASTLCLRERGGEVGFFS